MSESSTWLRLVRGQTGPCLYHSNGFKQILDGMHSPTTKYPSLALMLGGKRKNSALKELLAQNKVQTKLDSNLNIRIDNRTLHSTFPVLVADCDPHMCHLDVLRPDLPALPITWATSDDRDISDIILSQLIFLFTDVICIFAADAGGLEGVLTLLTTWALYGPGSTLPLRPHVLVVIESGVSRVSDDLRERDFLEGLFKQSGVSGTYASVHILTLPGATVAISTRLRDGILRRLDIARHERSEHRLLFSAAHFNRMFDLAVNHRCQSKMVRFDFIRASRVGNDVGTEYAAHLARFFMLLEGHLEDSQASFLASSMLMDAYPPNMHVFDPVSVFRTLYQGPCLQALGMTIKDSIELYKRCHLVESHFARLFEQFDCALKPTRFIHKETLNQAGTWLTGAQSNNLCLCCLRRRPQHHFSCHAICDVCVEIFGRPVDGSESQYSFERCLVCKHPQAIHVNLLPKTATVRALAIDGGGVRVVIPLQILILLQDLLAGHLTVKDLFDVAMGSSSGGAAVTDIFVLGHDPHVSLTTSRTLAQKAFKPHWLRKLPLPLRLLFFLNSCLKDEMYDSKKFEFVLKQHYGTKLRSFDVAKPSGIKIGLTTVATETNIPVLITNYRTILGCEGNYGYTHLCADAPTNEPLLWQSVRATSAAPGFFTTILLPGLGYCEDGALRYPNPAPLCRAETPRLWPWAPPVGVLLSLGTGTGTSTPAPYHGEGVRYRFPSRFYRWIMSMDGEVAWRDLCDQLDNDMCKSFFRLNISIPGGGPRLDSVDSMDELIRLTCEQGIGTVGRDAISALLAASLFFELVHHPGPDYRQCVGCIRSRIPGGGVVRAIMGLHGSEIEYTIDDKPIGNRLSENDMCGSCGRYCLPVRFSIASRATPLRLGLAAGGKFYRISPPQPVDWYSHQQGLEAEFGLANHGVQPRTWCKTCHRRIAREHAINLASTSYRRLKRKSTLDISFARRPRKVRFIL